jgi:hypothetical protein
MGNMMPDRAYSRRSEEILVMQPELKSASNSQTVESHFFAGWQQPCDLDVLLSVFLAGIGFKSANARSSRITARGILGYIAADRATVPLPMERLIKRGFLISNALTNPARSRGA